MKTICEYYYENYGKNLSTGYFVELGALNGKTQNSTLILEKKGWEGICIEPLPHNFKRLQKNRKCKLVEAAIYNKSGTIEIVDVGIPGWSGISETHQEQHKEKYNNNNTIYEVKCLRFEELNTPKKINYFQIDTEGSELEILKDIDFKTYNIEFISIEDNEGLKGNSKYHDFMKSINFKLEYAINQDKLYSNNSI